MAADDPPIATDGIAKAVVLVRADRWSGGEPVATFGSGFFITRDGHVISSANIIPETGPDDPEVKLSVMITDGARRKRLPAKLVGSDRRSGLVMLRVARRTSHIIEPKLGIVIRESDPVSVIGYDRASLQSSAALASPRSGTVTSLHRDKQDQLVAVETDVAIDGGATGSPLINANGQLLGVCYAAASEGRKVAFAISPDRVWAFYDRMKVVVLVNRTGLFGKPGPLEVQVLPGITPLVASGGSVAIRAPGVDYEVELEQSGRGWTASVDVPYPNSGQAANFDVTVRVLGSRGRVLADRRYRMSTHTEGDTSPLELLYERQLEKFPDHASLGEYAGKRQDRDGAGSGRSLSLNDRGKALDVVVVEGRRASEQELVVSLEEQAPALPQPSAPVTAPATAPAEVTISFFAPIKKGHIALTLDGEPFSTIEIDYRLRARPGPDKGKIKRVFELEPGSHTLAVALFAKGELLGERSFSEVFAAQSEWTLRVDQAKKGAKPTFFMVERR